MPPRQRRYDLSSRISIVFDVRTERAEIRQYDRPGGAAYTSVSLTADEWADLVERTPHIRALAERYPVP